ncbi:acyl-CoA dehydrogenase [Hydrocarboniclastica marina]|uniref:Acyl-coenzyme A dehydrogenase n=1 Tax=Hydrocarboniclastica marina TaxID=2259620 RepID=A0A4P7XK43_9ALTE|nr:acyl-CoA dehydrogenase [Hydrocarboniclastica marina]QCF26267.1 acyl-CoA dehydrogenase [Hydrocarboniclastica marina]
MSVVFLLISAAVLLYLGIGGAIGALVLVLATLAGMYQDHWHFASVLFGVLFLLPALFIMLPTRFRRHRLSAPLLGWVRGRLPKLSETEQEALKAGDVDWDGQLFSGRPDWQKLLGLPHASLSEEEQAFLDGPTNELCAMIDDWSMTHELYDLPEEAWTHIKKSGFFGMVIPKRYGGLGFSATAHSEIVMKIASRGVSAAVTVMVPNSLGPGELLVHYGTEQQREYYLPRLARGDEVPCFALTSPMAGSDAGAIPDRGIICRGQWNGEEVLGMKITWNKRYITLAPVATLIGLAIKVYDPDSLLGTEHDMGVTCVMVPADTEGVHSGARHLPMNTVFMNGPTWGEDVFIPLDQVIGGREMIGKGWTMLLECLAIGRSISLPALGTSGGKVACLTTGAYAAVREQFGRSISEFEGVQEAMEPMAGYTYMMDSARRFTSGMLDRGVTPSVPSALLKYRNTALMRDVVNHAMDVIAGRGVISGPRNFLARVYQAVPIAITVEGANILTRSLMVFGQGAIRCHPFIVQEIEAAGDEDQQAAVKKFDGVFYAHLAHTSRNVLRTFVLGLTHGWLEPVPAKGNLRKYYRQLSRFASAFSVLTDVSLLTLGGGLKARQRFTGRMSDALVHLYYASAAIKQWHEDGYPEDMRDIIEWSLEQSLVDLQASLHRAIGNFPVKLLRFPLMALTFPLGLRLKHPDDELGRRVGLSIVDKPSVRDRIVRGVYHSESPEDPVGRVMHALKLAQETEPARTRINKAIRKADPDELQDIEMLLGHQRDELLDWAIKHEVIDQSERQSVSEALAAMYDVIRVDAFAKEDIEKLAECSKGKLKEVVRP